MLDQALNEPLPRCGDSVPLIGEDKLKPLEIFGRIKGATQSREIFLHWNKILKYFLPLNQGRCHMFLCFDARVRQGVSESRYSKGLNGKAVGETRVLHGSNDVRTRVTKCRHSELHDISIREGVVSSEADKHVIGRKIARKVNETTPYVLKFASKYLDASDLGTMRKEVIRCQIGGG